MKIKSVVIVAIMGAQSFVQCMEKPTPGSFADITNAMETMTKIRDKMGTDSYASTISHLQQALANLSLATQPKILPEQTNLQKLESEVASIKKTQSEIHKDIMAMRKDITFMNGIVATLLDSKENAALVGSAIKAWIATYYPLSCAANNKETFSYRVKTDKPLRSDIEYVQYHEQDVPEVSDKQVD